MKSTLMLTEFFITTSRNVWNFLFFSNARTVRNAMDRARMNSAIRTFDKFAIRGENGGFCTVNDLKSISAADFQVLVDDIDNADVEKRIFA
mmetsp:Transcript_1351/g.1154  ORF Transcript_1351/g.1154 Transcript_1351/m.1154 type:complete len:91 (+) Transcript_1351:541-813(+)